MCSAPTAVSDFVTITQGSSTCIFGAVLTVEDSEQGELWTIAGINAKTGVDQHGDLIEALNNLAMIGDLGYATILRVSAEWACYLTRTAIVDAQAILGGTVSGEAGKRIIKVPNGAHIQTPTHDVKLELWIDEEPWPSGKYLVCCIADDGSVCTLASVTTLY